MASTRRRFILDATALAVAGASGAPASARCVVFNIEKFATHDGPAKVAELSGFTKKKVVLG